jgi:NADH pyrophosphatase NudC (nudix superfamily)
VIPYQVRWVDLRKEGPKLDGGAAALLAVAQGLVQWNLASAFDGRTGEPTASIQGGHARCGSGCAP